MQTVTEASNARYWKLLNTFGEETGVPMLLNTSFNNNVEPIVDSVEDAIACFLTTGLDRLVIGDFTATQRQESSREKLTGSCIRLMPYAKVHTQSSGAVVASQFTGKKVSVSPFVRVLLDSASRKGWTIGKALGNSLVQDESWVQEVMSLWEARLILVVPGSHAKSLTEVELVL